MPNNAYLRSTKREREIVNKARAEGKIAGRTAGSHSPFDVYVWDRKNKVMSLIQVKTKKGGRFRVERMQECFTDASVLEYQYDYLPLDKAAKLKTGWDGKK